MPPKQRITREMILESSFAMFCQEGMEVVNARSVAKSLNCSTQPIFSYFAGMDDLKNALQQKARELFESRMNEALRSDEPVFSGCLAYFHFAMDYPNLFRQLFLLKRDPRGGALAEVNDQIRSVVIAPLQEKTGKSAEQLEQQCLKLWVFTHGLASLAAMGLLDISKSEIEEMLREAEAHTSLA